MTSKVEIVDAALALTVAVVLTLALLLPSVQKTVTVSNNTRVFVFREYMRETDKGPAKVVEYFVDGLPSVVVFYNDDAEKLEAFRKYLERVGR